MQTVIALAIVTLCLLLAVRWIVRGLIPRGGKTACGCSGGCPATKPRVAVPVSQRQRPAA